MVEFAIHGVRSNIVDMFSKYNVKTIYLGVHSDSHARWGKSTRDEPSDLSYVGRTLFFFRNYKSSPFVALHEKINSWLPISNLEDSSSRPIVLPFCLLHSNEQSVCVSCRTIYTFMNLNPGQIIAEETLENPQFQRQHFPNRNGYRKPSHHSRNHHGPQFKKTRGPDNIFRGHRNGFIGYRNGARYDYRGNVSNDPILWDPHSRK